MNAIMLTSKFNIEARSLDLGGGKNILESFNGVDWP